MPETTSLVPPWPTSWPRPRARYGEVFVALLPTCKVWVNGDPAEPGTPVHAADEVAVLPPVSGG